MIPAIAILTPNTLAALGLADIIHRMMPGAETKLFSRFADLAQCEQADSFFHYFVSANELLAGASYFLGRQQKTIVLVHGADTGHLPQGFHTLNVCQEEKQLIRTILTLAHTAHTAHGETPEAVRRAEHTDTDAHRPLPRLTPREREVLRGIVSGLLNKEIAAQLGVSLATVITHRKNLTEKLGTRSVAALTIFAVTHGIVRSEEI